jgi:hypothetical protein
LAAMSFILARLGLVAAEVLQRWARERLAG